MKLVGLYNKKSFTISYNSSRVYSCNFIINLSYIIIEYIKLTDKLFFLSKNLNNMFF
jgi:hypothetical protein